MKVEPRPRRTLVIKIVWENPPQRNNAVRNYHIGMGEK
nr:MAG TPA: hypothetical protein [Caudoviricetes sp.]